MERLTKRNGDNVAYWIGANRKSFSDNQGNIYGEAITKLAEYEDAEEQGLLFRLPCKIGDTVWFVCRIYDRTKKDFVRVVHNGYIKAIKFSARPTRITVECEDLDRIGHCKGADYYVSNIGKSLFLTKAEAEKALAEMG